MAEMCVEAIETEDNIAFAWLLSKEIWIIIQILMTKTIMFKQILSKCKNIKHKVLGFEEYQDWLL